MECELGKEGLAQEVEPKERSKNGMDRDGRNDINGYGSPRIHQTVPQDVRTSVYIYKWHCVVRYGTDEMRRVIERSNKKIYTSPLENKASSSAACKSVLATSGRSSVGAGCSTIPPLALTKFVSEASLARQRQTAFLFQFQVYLHQVLHDIEMRLITWLLYVYFTSCT